MDLEGSLKKLSCNVEVAKIVVVSQMGGGGVGIVTLCCVQMVH